MQLWSRSLARLQSIVTHEGKYWECHFDNELQEIGSVNLETLKISWNTSKVHQTVTGSHKVKDKYAADSSGRVLRRVSDFAVDQGSLMARF